MSIYRAAADRLPNCAARANARMLVIRSMLICNHWLKLNRYFDRLKTNGSSAKYKPS